MDTVSDVPATAERKVAMPDRETTARRKSRRGEPKSPLRVVSKAPTPDAADGLEYAQCRSLGHTWRHIPQPIRPGENQNRLSYGSLGFKSRCDDCGTERTKWLGYSGNSMGLTYEYPDGYQRRGDSKLTPFEWRRTFMVTWMETDE